MAQQELQVMKTARIFLKAIFAVGVLGISAQCLFGLTCNVVTHGPPTDADKAFLAGDFAKAEDLYKADLASHPGDQQLAAGLVHALLRQQKVQEAADTVKAALTTAPKSVALIILRGEVEFRQGMPWAAGETANQAFTLDPCNPRTHLLISTLDEISSMHASARSRILVAHQIDPGDPEIRSAWIATLPLKQRISEFESYLSSPSGGDADDLRHIHEYLDHLKKLSVEPHKPCQLVSHITTAEIPFAPIMADATHIQAFGLDVKLNGHTSRLQIDTGAGGLVVSRSVAKRAGLQPFSQSEAEGIGDKGPQSSYTAFADSIRIGDLEFQNCSVEVVDSRNVVDVDGLIGMNVFSNFLVTLDFPMRKLALGPLPPRPGEAVAPAPGLKTNGAEDEDDDSQAESAKTNQQPGTAQNNAGPSAASGAPPSPNPVPHGPFDRYIAPEMKNYSRVYRVGHLLIIPAQLNGEAFKLFILDTGAWATSISPEAAREVTKLHNNSDMVVKGINGKVDKVFSASDVTFKFAQLSQVANGVVAFDTSHISRYTGMEISGFIGATTLDQLTIHIDYRDGLVKFDYDPHRGYNRF